MPGLLNAGMPPAAGTRPDAGIPPAAGAPPAGPMNPPVGGGGEGAPDAANVSPEEQAQYDQFMDRAFALAYDERTFPTIMNRIVKAPDPVEGLAAVTAMLVGRLKDSAARQNVPLSPDVLYHGGAALLEDLADTAGKAGLHDYTPDEVEGALYRALDIYRGMEGENPAGRQAVAQDWEMMVQADRAGTLDRVLPGLAGRQDGPAVSGQGRV